MLLAAAAAVAIEPDPYTHRDMDLADSLDILDAKVNDALDGIAASWDRGENEGAFVTAVYRTLGSFHWVDRLERWAMDAPEVDKLPTTRRDAVFAKVPLIRAQMARIGLAPTINVNGVYIGTDKIGHFISQGRKFYRRVQRHGSEERAARLTAAWEGLIWGRLMSGIYSNADLVANYEDTVSSGGCSTAEWWQAKGRVPLAIGTTRTPADVHLGRSRQSAMGRDAQPRQLR